MNQHRAHNRGAHRCRNGTQISSEVTADLSFNVLIGIAPRSGIVPTVLSDTGNINSSGGVNDASLLSGSVPGLLSGEVLSATAGGEGSFSHSVIDGLVVNGLSIPVTGSPNQTLSLLGGAVMILNEQTGSQNGSITVNAIHVIVPGVTDVVIDSAFAAINGQLIGTSGGPLLIVALLLQDVNIGIICPKGQFFFTGGGWIFPTPNNDKGTFGVSGGIRQDGTPFGHLEYVDHGNGMNVHGTGVTNCESSGSVAEVTGTADVHGPSFYTGPRGSFFYVVDVTDDDTSGIDTFEIRLFSNSTTCTPQVFPSPPLPSTCASAFYTAGGPLGGGQRRGRHRVSSRLSIRSITPREGIAHADHVIAGWFC